MERDSRYGAYLMLALVFAGVFFAAHFARYGLNRGVVQTPSGSPLSGGEQSPPQFTLFQGGAVQTPSGSPLSGGEQIPLNPSFSKGGVLDSFSQAGGFPSAPSNIHLTPVSVKAHPTPVIQHKIDFPGFPININTADVEELMKVPGIGPKTARNIIEKRAQIGRFSSINQLTEVQRIGRVRLDRMRRYIAVEAVRPIEG